MRRTIGLGFVLAVAASVAGTVPAAGDVPTQLHAVQGQYTSTYAATEQTMTPCTSQDGNEISFTGSRTTVQLTTTQSNLLPGLTDWGVGSITVTGTASAGALSGPLHPGPGDELVIPSAALTIADVQLTLQSGAGHADVTLHLSPRGGAMQCANWDGVDSASIGGGNPSSGWWASATGYMTFDAKVYPASSAGGQPIEETGTGWFTAQESHNTWTSGGRSFGSGSSALTVLLDSPGAVTTTLDSVPPVVTGTPNRAPNAAGWYNAPVAITWTAFDDLTPSDQLTLPAPTTVATEGASQSVTSSPVCDTAGNCATGTATVSLDMTAPTITASTDRAPNPAGWFNSPVTVSFACADHLSGVATCPDPVTVSGDGKNQAVTRQTVDHADNSTPTTVQLSLDQTAPFVTAPRFEANPTPSAQSTTVTATASDALSGVAGGEIWIGTDPGQAHATPMTLTGQTLSSTVPALPSGIYTVGVRSQDAAGNWSDAQTALLVSYDPSGGFATGGGWILPGGATSDTGDQLPGLDATSKANFGFVVRYQNGQSTVPSGNFQFHYNAGKFHLASTGYKWLVVTNTQWAHFQGRATIEGSAATYPIQVDARDSSGTGQADRLVLKVYAPGADPATAAPVYQASGDVTGGAITIHRN